MITFIRMKQLEQDRTYSLDDNRACKIYVWFASSKLNKRYLGAIVL